jgi:hypothetical protein
MEFKKRIEQAIALIQKTQAQTRSSPEAAERLKILLELLKEQGTNENSRPAAGPPR